MTQRAQAAAAILILALLFLIANRGAYQGYFSDDDLNNIGWTRVLPASTMAEGLLLPRYYLQHFRPVGHGTFALLANTAGLDFRWYVALLHVLHFATCLALWRLLLRLDLPPAAAASGAIFLLFQMTLFDALWKPMYLFDVWCGLFCVLSLWAWTSQRFWLSFLAFWLAVKSKEHAVMLAAVIALYEWWTGTRRWIKLAPLAAVAAIFAIQAVWMNRSAAPDYTLRPTPAALTTTIAFYAARLWILPMLLAAGWPDWRARWGAATAILLLLPLLALPTRLFAAYLYAPMAGAAITAAVAASRTGWRIALLFFCLWLPYNFQQLRAARRAELTTAMQNRAYVQGVLEIPPRLPEIRRFIHDGAPPGMKPWGIEGALRIAYQRMGIEVLPADTRGLAAKIADQPVALLSWEPLANALHAVARRPGDPDASYLETGRFMPVWQLLDGWYEAESTFRWAKPRATARLLKPEWAREFEVRVNVGEGFLKEAGPPRLTILVNGQPLGETQFTRSGWQTARFPVPPGAAAPAEIEFRSALYKPASGDPRTLGIPIGAFGFLPKEKP